MPLRALRLFPLLNAAELNFTTSFTYTLHIAASRAWSRRAIAHAQPKIPEQDAHGTTRGKKSTKSGSSILKVGPSRYILYIALYLTFRILTAMVVEWLALLLSHVVPPRMPK